MSRCEDAVGGTAGTSRDFAGDLLKRLGWDESNDCWQGSVVQRDDDGNLITTGSWECGRYPQDGMRLARVLKGDEDMLADVFQIMLDADENWAEKWRRAVRQQSDNFVEADRQRQRADRFEAALVEIHDKPPGRAEGLWTAGYNAALNVARVVAEAALKPAAGEG